MNEYNGLEEQSFSTIWGAIWTLIRAHFPLLAAGTVGLGLVAALMDTYTPKLPFIVQSLTQFFVQGLIMAQLLRAVVLDPETVQPRFGTLFGSGMLTNLGIIAGLLLLVVPGLILAARWMLVWPLIMHENLGVTDAIKQSWHMTKGAAGRIIALIVPLWLVGIVILVLVGVASGMFDVEDGQEGLAFNIFVNVLVSALVLYGTAFSVALYSLCNGSTLSRERLVDTFA